MSGRIVEPKPDVSTTRPPAVDMAEVSETGRRAEGRRPRGGGARAFFRRRGYFVARLAVLAVILALWEYVSGRWVQPFFVSSPSAIATQLVEWIADGTLFRHFLFTMRAAMWGLVVGGVAGSAFGAFLAGSRRIGGVLHPFVTALYSIPKAAIAPLFVLWFGIGLGSKVAVSASIVFFFMFYNVYTGVTEVDEDLKDVVRLMGGRRRHVLLKCVLPSALVWVFAGLRIAVPYSIVGAIFGEVIASTAGLGWLIVRAQSTFNTAGVFAGIIAVMVISLSISAIVNWVERKSTKYRFVEAASEGAQPTAL